MIQSTRMLGRVLLFSVLPAFSVLLAAAQPLGPIVPEDGGLIDLPMLRDPALAVPESVIEFDPRYKPMWLLAMNRPEFDLRLDSIEAFAEVSRDGMTGLDDVVPALMDRLSNDENIKVRLAAADALAVFDARQAADPMLVASQDLRNVGSGMVLAVDPSLAVWSHAPAVPVWMARLEQVNADPTRAASAMRSLATVKATDAIAPLLDVAIAPNQRVDLRLEAGRALGHIATQGLVEDAQRLAQGARLDRQIAVMMLGSHTDVEAVALLRTLAVDDDPATAAAALGVLNTIDPAVVVGMAAELVDRNDANVRYQAAEALATDGSDESIVLLGELLNDRSVAVRNRAREALVVFAAQSDLGGAVRAELADALERDGWRGLEQSALLAGIIDDKTTSGRLTQLLDHDRAEVRLATAAALRQLAVPETMPMMLDRAKVLTEVYSDSTLGKAAAFGRETTQLFMAFGENRFAPAEAVMKQYIPKSSGFDGDARAAAVYALGKLYEGQLNNEYVGAFRGRLSDINPMDPEYDLVRRFAAIGLGRMNAQAATGVLNRFASDEATTEVGAACRWSITRITGQAPPEPEPIVSRPRDFFLVPLDE